MKQAVIGLCALCLVSALAVSSAAAAETLAPCSTGPIITYPQGYDTASAGASSYQRSGDHADSPYFAHPDIYNMRSGKGLTVISQFQTYQQTTEWSCGNCSTLMVLNHYGVTKWDELSLGRMMGSNQDTDGDNTAQPGAANERGEWGTSTDKIANFFTAIGWKVASSLTEGKLDGGKTFDDPMKFKDWAIGNISSGTPIMIEDTDWGGHWKVLIGYDTMGTDSFGDDVLLFADPYDTSDHLQDGYYIVPAERFFYMWFDAHILPESQQMQQWVIATPKAN